MTTETMTTTRELDLHVHIGPFVATQDEEANACQVCQCTLRAGAPAVTLEANDDRGPVVCCMECGLGHARDLLSIVANGGLERHEGAVHNG